ncbi:MAG: hypothetical protein WCH44_12770 [Betaproteobacteria bacterium]
MQSANLVPGVDYDFGGGRVYTVAALPIVALMRLQSRLTNLSTDNALSPESVDTILQATHAALKRNYPDITLDQVGELVDVANMLEVISLVLDVGGFKRKAAAEAEAAKNQPAQTAAPTVLPTGPV